LSLFHDYGLGGTCGDTFAAVGALIIINLCQEIGDVDGVILTYTLTGLTADAAYLALASDFPAGVKAAAEDMDQHVIGHQGDQVPGTGYHTEPTGSTLVFINYRQAIGTHMHRIKLAGLDAASQAQTAVLASFVTAQQMGSFAVFQAHIFSCFLGFRLAAAAVNPCYQAPVVTLGLDTHNLSHFGSYAGTADGASVNGRFTLGYSFGKGTAAGIPAGTAVGSRESFFNFIYPGI
jgi:hypothetical protein